MLLSKIERIKEKLEPLSRDIPVESRGKNYRVISEQKLVNELRPLLKEEDIGHYIVDAETSIQVNTVEGGDGKSLLFSAVVNMTVRFVDLDTGEELNVASVGMGTDTQDKCVGMAYTYAYKYALLKLFNIAYADDTDAYRSKEYLTEVNRNARHELITITTKQADFLETLCKTKNFDRDYIVKTYGYSPENKKIPQEVGKQIIDYMKSLPNKTNEDLPF